MNLKDSKKKDRSTRWVYEVSMWKIISDYRALLCRDSLRVVYGPGYHTMNCKCQCREPESSREV